MMSMEGGISTSTDVLRPQDSYDHEVYHDNTHENSLYFGVVRHIFAIEFDSKPVTRRWNDRKRSVQRRIQE